MKIGKKLPPPQSVEKARTIFYFLSFLAGDSGLWGWGLFEKNRFISGSKTVKPYN